MDEADPNIADDRQETDKDIRLLTSLSQIRLDFSGQLVAQSIDKSVSITDALRGESCFDLARFFYLLDAYKIRSVAEFDGLIERHNSYVSGLLCDAEKMSRMGLNRDRLIASIFDGETKPRVLRIWSDSPGSIDQSSLARLLVCVMSDETARKTIVACSKAGYLTRENSVFRMVLVKSGGLIEKIFGDSLRRARLTLKN